MRRGALIALVLLGACGFLSSQRGGRKSEYVDEEAGFRFRVPSGWAEETSANPFKKSDRTRARFLSPNGDAEAAGLRADVGGKSCVRAAKDALGEVGGLALRGEKSFKVAADGDDVTAWRGKVDGKRRGWTAFFCRQGTLALVEASADPNAYDDRKSDIADVIESFEMRAGDQLVKVEAKPEPTPIPNFVHVVEWRGQTLGQIARWYTGAYDNWKKLTEMNDLTQPDAALKIGREVKIPQNLVRRPEPMPKPKVSGPKTGKVEKGEESTGGVRPEDGEGEDVGSVTDPREPEEAPASDSPGGDEPAPSEDEDEEPPPLPPVIGPR